MIRKVHKREVEVIYTKKALLFLFSLIIAAVLFSACNHSGDFPETGTTEDFDKSEIIELTDESGSITITDEGSYTLTGTLSDGQVIVDTNGKVILYLNGVNITSAKSSAVIFNKYAKASVILVDGTENYLSDGADKVKKKDTDGDTNAVLFSSGNLDLSGGGTLHITGNNRGGIHSGDKAKIHSGILNISAKNQGIFAQNEFVLNGGEINITQSKEGIECKGKLTVNGGISHITAKDDALNAAVDLVINGGDIYADCEGDGFDSNGNMTINGGTIYIFSGNIKNGPLDVSDGDKIGKFTINGGTVVAAGGDMSVAVEKNSKQNYIWIRPQNSYSEPVNVVSATGDDIIGFQLPKQCSLIFISTDKIKADTEYILQSAHQ